jgi:hypothetical protein
MGWARTILLGDIGNRLDIEDTERDIARLRRGIVLVDRRNGAQEERIEALERENDELKLSVATLIRLLVGKHVLRKEEIALLVTSLESDERPTDDGAEAEP